jgi:hypothetical protein
LLEEKKIKAIIANFKNVIFVFIIFKLIYVGT